MFSECSQKGKNNFTLVMTHCIVWIGFTDTKLVCQCSSWSHQRQPIFFTWALSNISAKKGMFWLLQICQWILSCISFNLDKHSIFLFPFFFLEFWLRDTFFPFSIPTWGRLSKFWRKPHSMRARRKSYPVHFMCYLKTGCMVRISIPFGGLIWFPWALIPVFLILTKSVLSSLVRAKNK